MTAYDDDRLYIILDMLIQQLKDRHLVYLANEAHIDDLIARVEKIETIINASQSAEEVIRACTD